MLYTPSVITINCNLLKVTKHKQYIIFLHLFFQLTIYNHSFNPYFTLLKLFEWNILHSQKNSGRGDMILSRILDSVLMPIKLASQFIMSDQATVTTYTYK